MWSRLSVRRRKEPRALKVDSWPETAVAKAPQVNLIPERLEARIFLSVTSGPFSPAASTPTTAAITLRSAATGLPAGWSGQDIGAVGLAGSVVQADGKYTVKGAGANIGGTADAFQYVSRTLSGDGQIV